MLPFAQTPAVRWAMWATGALVVILSVPVPAHPLQETPLLDKWTHFVLFCALGWTYLNAALGLPVGSFRIRLLLGWGATGLMGLLTEGLQGFLPWRSADWLDVGANAIGATLAVLSYPLLRRRFSSLSP